MAAIIDLGMIFKLSRCQRKKETTVQRFNTTKGIEHLLCSRCSNFGDKEEVRLRGVLKDK